MGRVESPTLLLLNLLLEMGRVEIGTLGAMAPGMDGSDAKEAVREVARDVVTCIGTRRFAQGLQAAARIGPVGSDELKVTNMWDGMGWVAFCFFVRFC